MTAAGKPVFPHKAGLKRQSGFASFRGDAWTGIAESITRLAQSNGRHLFVMALVALTTLSHGADIAAAQLRIRAEKKSQHIEYDLTKQAQSFAPVRWRLQNQFSQGCVVRWEATPFQHVANPEFRADCRLFVRLVQTAPRQARWSVTAATDSTEHQNGKRRAEVAVLAADRGQAHAEVTVRFEPGDVTRLAGGQYQTTVVGTISGL